MWFFKWVKFKLFWLLHGCLVRQGENLSPLLFSLFRNDFESYFDTNGIPSLQLNDPIFDTLFKIQLLLYADDTSR